MTTKSELNTTSKRSVNEMKEWTNWLKIDSRRKYRRVNWTRCKKSRNWWRQTPPPPRSSGANYPVKFVNVKFAKINTTKSGRAKSKTPGKHRKFDFTIEEINIIDCFLFKMNKICLYLWTNKFSITILNCLHIWVKIASLVPTITLKSRSY